MTGPLAQLCSLVSYGNEYLAAKSVPAGYYPGSTVFAACSLVDFRDFKLKFPSFKNKEYVVADDPISWFRLLAEEGCQRLRLYYHPGPADGQPVGTAGGGGTWVIESIYGPYSHYWANRWEVTRPDAPDEKIWSVNYARLMTRQQPTDMQVLLAEARERLAEALFAVSEFAAARGHRGWAETFSKAGHGMSSDEPQLGYRHSDLIVVQNYPPAARQALFAAAWLLDGMGSWDALSFAASHDREVYETLSAQLYDAINQTVLAVINSY